MDIITNQEMPYLTVKHFVYTINGLDYTINFKNLIEKLFDKKII